MINEIIDVPFLQHAKASDANREAWRIPSGHLETADQLLHLPDLHVAIRRVID
jgi:hypothetical protein